MGLEDYWDIDDADWGWASPEISEKYKEAYKKAWVWAKKAKKDEKKARKQDFFLASILVKLILDKKYEGLLDALFVLLDRWIPSPFILWIMSLVYQPISDKIRGDLWQSCIEFNFKEKEPTEFHDNTLHEKVKTRINQWYEDVINILSIEYSNILTKRLIKTIKSDKDILVFVSNVFTFFFKEAHIDITNSKSRDYCHFIIDELYWRLRDLELDEI